MKTFIRKMLKTLVNPLPFLRTRINSIINKLLQTLVNPEPFRVSIISLMLKKLKLGSHEFRLLCNAVERPSYSCCVLVAAKLASALGIHRISVIEFGVAGGNGLLELENMVEEVERIVPIKIDIFGFDTGKGLPLSDNYKDQLYFWQEGHFEMNEEALRKRLRLSKLVLGDVSKSVETFISEYNPAPIGAIMFDLDYYSSTKDAFKLFNYLNSNNSLPRIYTYMDDISSVDLLPANEFTGVRCAINEFNSENNNKKIARMEHLSRFMRLPKPWNELVYVFHNFEHKDYNTYVKHHHATKMPLV